MSLTPSSNLLGIMRWRALGVGVLEEPAVVSLLTGDITVSRPLRAGAPLGFWYDDVRYGVEEILNQCDMNRRPHIRTTIDLDFLVQHAAARAACRQEILEQSLPDEATRAPAKLRF